MNLFASLRLALTLTSLRSTEPDPLSPPARGSKGSGFSDDEGSWRVIATDGAKRGGNRGATQSFAFTVDAGGDTDTGGGGGGGTGGTVVQNEHWAQGGAIQTAAGRLLYEMPNGGGWSGYVCSGTVATDDVTERSIIITAAHCVYNDTAKAFARNVLFIPNQDGTTGSGSDGNCSNDPLGCWAPDYGMAGSKLNGTTAACLFDVAKAAPLSLGANPDGQQGVVVAPSDCGGSGGGTGGGGGGDPEPGADVTASVSAYKRRGGRKTWDRSWSGATTASVDIYLDGARAATTANDGSYTLTSGQKGSMSHAHRVCEAGSTTVCSPTVNTTF